MSRLRRCAIIQSLTGFGRVSSMVIIPTLSAMGIQVCPVPTAVLSTYTGSVFQEYSFADMTKTMEETFHHWSRIGLKMEGIYSGFLGSVEQCKSVSAAVDAFRSEDTVVLIDPVMGDGGVFYESVSPEMAERMREIAAKADIVTPNFTELFLLLGRPFQPDASEETLDDMIRELAALGPQKIVVTSFPAKKKETACCRVYDRGTFSTVEARQAQGMYPGTGDLYAALLLGMVLNGQGFHEAAEFAAEKISRILIEGQRMGEPIEDGVLLEAFLPEIGQSVDRDAIWIPGEKEGHPGKQRCI